MARGRECFRLYSFGRGAVNETSALYPHGLHSQLARRPRSLVSPSHCSVISRSDRNSLFSISVSLWLSLSLLFDCLCVLVICYQCYTHTSPFITLSHFLWYPVVLINWVCELSTLLSSGCSVNGRQPVLLLLLVLRAGMLCCCVVKSSLTSVHWPDVTCNSLVLPDQPSGLFFFFT